MFTQVSNTIVECELEDLISLGDVNYLTDELDTIYNKGEWSGLDYKVTPHSVVSGKIRLNVKVDCND